GHQRILDHVAGTARILADDDAVAMVAALEGQAGRHADAHGHLGSHGKAIGLTPNSVRAKVTPGHLDNRPRTHLPLRQHLPQDGMHFLSKYMIDYYRRFSGRTGMRPAGVSGPRAGQPCGCGSSPVSGSSPFLAPLALGAAGPVLGTVEPRELGESSPASRDGFLPASSSLISSPDRVSYSS